MNCAECEYARAEELARGRSCLRCWSPEVEPYWHGRGAGDPGRVHGGGTGDGGIAGVVPGAGWRDSMIWQTLMVIGMSVTGVGLILSFISLFVCVAKERTPKWIEIAPMGSFCIAVILMVAALIVRGFPE